MNIHETAVVDSGASVGEGTVVWHFSHIMPRVRIGERCIIGQNVFIGNGVNVGNGVKIQNNVSLYDGLQVEDDVFLGPSCVFTNVRHPRAFIERKHAFSETVVEKGATVGANATVVCGVRIGRFAMIGAGAVVTSDVPAYALMVGVPARRIGWVCECGKTLSVDAHCLRCPDCSEAYHLTEGVILKEEADRIVD